MKLNPEDNRDILKEIVEDKHSEEKIEFMKEAKQIVSSRKDRKK
ncbi:hypothetical protein [Bacillus sp. CGMCC 1.16541]|nr:hypothetical protein [Bacillus sp. CGMCC 1.16541]